MKALTRLVVVALLMVAVGVANALAWGSYQGPFNTKYGTTGSRIDTCDLCHTAGYGLNPYGADFKANGLDFAAIERLDSDKDGADNITEISARTFPGDSGDKPSQAPAPPPAPSPSPTPDPTPTPAPDNQPPTADFRLTVFDLTAYLDANFSTDVDGSVVSFAWDFGDGATGTGATAVHAYFASGTYEITLTVADNQGATGVKKSTVTVGAVTPPPAPDPVPDPGVPPVPDPGVPPAPGTNGDVSDVRVSFNEIEIEKGHAEGEVVVKNVGTLKITVPVIVSDGNGWSGRKSFTLKPGKSAEFCFEYRIKGDVTLTVSAELPGDANPGDNVATWTITVKDISNPSDKGREDADDDRDDDDDDEKEGDD